MCMVVLQKISTGCDKIDQFLGGGIATGGVVLIYGEAETGKTTLAMQCAVNCARQGCKTLFVDCDNTFSVQRLSQIASDKFREVAELIILMRPNDFREQGVVVDRLADWITKNFGFVVFDTITSLYRLNVGESASKTFEMNRELNRQLAVLAQVARTQRVAVLVASQVHSVLNRVPVSVQPVATRVLKFWADTVIALNPTEIPQIVRVVLEKNPRKRQAITCDLKIEETGIHQYPMR
jgi:DNA repair protein RadB